MIYGSVATASILIQAFCAASERKSCLKFLMFILPSICLLKMPRAISITRLSLDLTAVEVGVSPQKLVDNLQKAATSNNDMSGEAKQLLKKLAEQHSGWTTTAGVHQGGLGGAAGSADPNHHVTVSTGHHVQFNDKMHMKKITGPGFAIPGPQRTEPSRPQQKLDGLKQKYGLNDKQALDVKRRDPSEKEQDAAKRVLAGQHFRGK